MTDNGQGQITIVHAEPLTQLIVRHTDHDFDKVPCKVILTGYDIIQCLWKNKQILDTIK